MNIGIDFSINSPGICVYDGTEYKFYGFYNEAGKNFDKKIPTDFKIHNEINSLSDVQIHKFIRRRRHDDYSIDQWQKIQDAASLAHQINNLLTVVTDDNAKNATITIEGYSYGSKGNSFIDLIAFNSTLRNVLYESLEKGTVIVKSPGAVKMIAGKGNLGKDKMIEAFIENKLQDSSLINSAFWNWCNQNRDLVLEKIPKPIDDLVDAYWVCRSGFVLD